MGFRVEHDCPHSTRTVEPGDPGLPFRWLLVSALDHPDIDREDALAELLCERERSTLAGFRFERRRHKWLLGRLAAKVLLRSVVEELTGRSLDPTALFIGNEPSGAPYAEIDGSRAQWPISISHRTSWGVAAVAIPPVCAIGIDVEAVEARSGSWFQDYFVAEEIAEVADALPGREQDLAVARIWSAKESVLKTLGLGLRLDTRAIHVSTPKQASTVTIGDASPNRNPGEENEHGRWMPLDISLSPEVVDDHLHSPASVRAYWRKGAGYVLTVALLQPFRATHTD